MTVEQLTARLEALLLRPENIHFTGSHLDMRSVVNVRRQCHHYNGHVRQSAVELLGALRAGQGLPDILERLNDWARPVRQAARVSLHRLMTADNAGLFVQHLPELYRLRFCGRDDHQDTIDSVVSFLLRPENCRALSEAIDSRVPALARLALALTIEHNLLPITAVVERAFASGDVIVRYTALRGLINQGCAPDDSAMLQAALRDSFAPIRLAALAQLRQRHPALALSLAPELLFDTHTRLRLQAIELLGGASAAQSNYLTALEQSGQSTVRLCSALWGVYATRCQRAAELAKRFSAHRYPRVRRAALQTMAKLRSDEPDDFLFAWLGDASPTVTKEAVRLLLKRKASLSLNELNTLFERAVVPHQRRACLALLNCLNKWDRLIFLLAQYRLSPSAAVKTELERWLCGYNDSGVQPRDGQIERLIPLINDTSALNNDSVMQELSAIAGFFAHSVRQKEKTHGPQENA